MAMFVLVIDTSLMNVSISAVIKDLHTTASGVQSAIALEALVSAAFILTNSKMGDLIGRRRAYVIGLLAYAVGAVAMTLAHSLNTIIIFWAIIGGLGASLLLPAMQSLIHGNFTGDAQKRAYALVGASAAIAAAVGPLLGGFLTTYLSWRVGFGLEALIILVVLSQIRLVKDVPYTGPRKIDIVGALLSVVGMGGVVLGILVWQEGGQFVGLLIGIGALTLAAFAYWLVRNKRLGKPTLLDPDLFKHLNFRIGVSQQMLQQVTLGGAMIALPLFLQMTLEYNAMEAGLSLAPLSLSMFGMAMLAGRKAGKWRAAQIVMAGFALQHHRNGSHHPIGAESGLRLVPGDSTGDCRLGPGHARVPTQQLHPRSYCGGPRQRSRWRELGGRFLRVVLRAGNGRGIMLWALALSFTHMTEANPVIPPAQQQHIYTELDHDAEIMSNTQLQKQIAEEPKAIQDEVLVINARARNLSLQFALLVPAIASLLGLANSFRMLRLPEIPPEAASKASVSDDCWTHGSVRWRRVPFIPEIHGLARQGLWWWSSWDSHWRGRRRFRRRDLRWSAPHGRRTASIFGTRGRLSLLENP